MTKGTVFGLLVFTALCLSGASYAEENADEQDILFSSEEASLLDEFLIESDQSTSGSRTSRAAADPVRLARCLADREVICRLYCRFQTKNSYDDCYDGWLFWEGCIQKLEAMCRARFG